MVFCVMIDRNGYLPVHNKIYSHPQRPGDVAFNTANKPQPSHLQRYRPGSPRDAMCAPI